MYGSYVRHTIEKPEGPVCFCASFDGKGVLKIKPLDKSQAKSTKHLGKGKKRGEKANGDSWGGFLF